MIQAIVGAGGKTTYIKRHAEQYRKNGLKVLVTTSTHMMAEEDTLLTDDAGEIINALEEKGYVMAGIPEGQKVKALSQETYEKVCNYADVVMIEADGSKHMPIKFPAEYEPVIYDDVDEIVVICGLHALNQKMKDVSHRQELVKKCLGIEADTLIRPEHVQRLLKKGYLEPLKETYSNKTIKIEPSHDESLYQRVIARLLAEEKDVSLVKAEWFLAQPRLIICGAGHVAYDLVRIASCLDFHIKVIDDRAEFANKERFILADEVVCDSFKNLEEHLEKYAFYVVVTRGHKMDFDCVKTILSHSYNYLGMIGSRRKVKTLFEKLESEGVSEEQIRTIHAPIGLAIHANTPAEIAVSIMAEIISEKNQKYTSFVSREMLNNKEHGTLCIIIEKSGSSPRGEGSMMFVNDEMVIDSVGGGTMEEAVIRDAKNTQEVTVREYHLTNEESENLGMVCGGRNKILFIPI